MQHQIYNMLITHDNMFLSDTHSVNQKIIHILK